MDPNPNPNMDLPPPTPITTAADHLIDPSPAITDTTNFSHPPYPEMIVAAISALKDKDGSSRQAISKYIEKEFANLHPTHATLLTHHLKRMKTDGQLTMVKHSYMLPMPSGSFAPLDFPAADNNNHNNFDNLGSGLSKRKPGRPPKLKPVVPGISGVQNQMPNVQVYNANVNANDGVQQQQQQAYQPQFQYNVGGGGGGLDLQASYGSGLENAAGGGVGGPEPLFASLGLGDDGVAVPSPGEKTGVVAKRGRGRPPKSGGHGGQIQRKEAGAGAEVQGVEKRAGRPGRPKSITAMMAANGLRVKARGRPKRIGVGPVTVPLSGNVLKPRGRPKRLARPNVSVNGVAGELGLVKRRPGRPPVNKFAKLTGKPMGRPSKSGPGTAVLVTDPRQLVVYQELKNKYELLQSKVKHVATMVKTCIDPTYGNAALGALQELEALAGEANAPSHGQT